jgi:ABC-type Mn2+/Zn2+ transport system ATPase subunit
MYIYGLLKMKKEKDSKILLINKDLGFVKQYTLEVIIIDTSDCGDQ